VLECQPVVADRGPFRDLPHITLWSRPSSLLSRREATHLSSQGEEDSNKTILLEESSRCMT